MSSPGTFLGTALAIAVPWLYLTFRPSTQPAARLPSPTSVLLLFHTLYIVHTLLRRRPLNLFTAFDIPLNAPITTIRSLLLGPSPPDALPQHLQTLLERLSSLDLRSIYVRFGHSAIATCEHCRTYDDYALYALSGPLLEYVRETAVIGVLTIKGSPIAPLRTLGIAALVGAAALEGYYLSTAHITIPRGSNEAVFWWHDTLYTLRQTLFLLLPALLLLLPSLPFLQRIPFLSRLLPLSTSPHPPQAPAEALTTTLQTLSHTLTALHTLKYTHGALMRVPALRARAGEWWAGERREGAWVRGDERVRKAARGAGVGYDVGAEGEGGSEGGEGPLRKSAKMAVEALQVGYQPSVYWLGGAVIAR